MMIIIFVGSEIIAPGQEGKDEKKATLESSNEGGGGRRIITFAS